MVNLFQQENKVCAFELNINVQMLSKLIERNENN